MGLNSYLYYYIHKSHQYVPNFAHQPRTKTSRNLWNFNAKHFFTDSSGAFWRERRLTPGLYTDGDVVYEHSYRYFDGKNGMKPISKLDALLKSKAVKDRVKSRLIRRLKDDSPDIVVEE